MEDMEYQVSKGFDSSENSLISEIQKQNLNWKW